MADTQEKLTLEIASAEHISDSKGGYRRYTITSKDGESHNVLLQPDAVYKPKTGDTVTFFKGSYNAWILDRNSVGDNPAGGSPAGSKSNSYVKKDDYWKQKDGRDVEWQDYQKVQRDPKIEFQSYFTHVASFYVGAIPTLKNPLTTTQEVDAYIDDAYAKAEAIFARRQKSFAKKN